ncbi:MAG: hypothetical protein R3E65_06645 [Steroidobacteraceae bacterium]
MTRPHRPAATLRRLAAALLLLSVALLDVGTAWAQSQTPIARSARFSGNINFVATGGSLRTEDNTGNACAVAPTSTATLSGIPAGTSVVAAFLYWGASTSGGATPVVDAGVTLNGTGVTAARSFTAVFNNGGTLLPYFGAVADVTGRVTGNGSYTFGGLTVSTGAPHCAVQAVTAGWGLIVVYAGTNERLRAINIFDGLQFFRGNALTLTPDGFRVPTSNIDGRVAVVTLEGDPVNSGPLGGFTESLTFNGSLLDDGLVPAGSDPVVQQFDGTVNSQGTVTAYGVDVDTYDVSTLLAPGQQSATTVYSSGGDLVLLLAQVVSATSEPRVDLQLTKSAATPLVVGSNADYTLTVTNGTAGGNEREDNVITVTDVLPAGLTYVSGTGSGWTCAASGQTVTCTRPPALDPGATAPPLTLTVAVDAAAFPSISNTASVTSASFDFDPANNSSTVVSPVLRPDLGSSSKTVVDPNGGEVDPGDVLRYTITLTETGGAAATGVDVLDDLPANTSGFTLLSLPAGATDASTPTGGANGAGLLDLRGITVPAGGSIAIEFEVTVLATTSVGATIENTATIAQPNGPGASPAAPTLVVSPSRIPAGGLKPLYLRRVSATSRPLSRVPAPSGETFETVPGNGSRVWTLAPALQQPLSIAAGGIPVRLWLTRSGATSSRTLLLTLADPVSGFSTSVTQTVSPPTGTTPALFTFVLPNPLARTFPAGAALTLTIAQTSPTQTNRVTRVHPIGVGAGTSAYSRIELDATTVINVDSVQAFDAAYPAGSATTTHAPGADIWVRASISDPFGSFDITAATVSIIDSTGTTRVSAQAMTQVADDGVATRVFEFPYSVPAAGPVGGWSLQVVGIEGTEGLVTDLGVGPLQIAIPPPQLRVQKTSEVISDPFNGTLNPRRIPGAIVRYAVTVTNTGPGAVDADSLVIQDVLPPDTELLVAPSLGAAIEFLQGVPPSGLSFSPATGVAYSNQAAGGAPWNYVPAPGAEGFDPAIRGLRITPSGSLAGSTGGGDPSFTVRFRVRVR